MTTWIRQTVIVLVLLAAGRSAQAQIIEVIEPVGGYLDLGPVNIGTTSQTKRITFKNNDTNSPSLEKVYIYNTTVFTIAASGGDLAPNHTAYWDIVASPRDLTR